MRLKTGTFGFTVFLAALTALGPLSTDMYLPSLPAIQRAFDADTGAVQMTLSIFLIGAAGAQLVYGPLSDRYGRRPLLLFGYVVYVAASLGCLFAGSIGELTFARFFQALGSGASVVLARAIVRDLYAAEHAGQMLARMASIMGVVPAIAPVVGGLVEGAFGWQANFLTMAAGGALLGIVSFFGLDETLHPERRQSANVRAIFAHYGRLLRHAHFLRYLLVASFCFAGVFSFVSGSSFVLQNIYGLSPVAYGLSFGAMIFGYIGGTLTGARFTLKLGIERMLRLGTSVAMTGGVLMVALSQSAFPPVAAIILPMMLYTYGVGVTMPQSMAGALTPFPEIAGTASALMGFLQSAFSAAVGLYVGHMLSGGSAMPMILTTAAMGALSFLIVFTMGRQKLQ
jgi:DHA1 family bicyclomycin/chloramphenicol resistance-like MFS transporter